MTVAPRVVAELWVVRCRSRSVKKTLLALLLSALVATIGCDARPRAFPLLGLWRVSTATTADGRSTAGNEQMEMEFSPDGVLFVTAASPNSGITSPVRLRFRYTFQPPDVVTYTLTGTHVERQRFTITGDTVAFEHLDYKTTSKLRRIKKTEFTEPPKDIERFPEGPSQ